MIEEQMPSPVSEEIWKLILDRSKTYDIIIHLLKGETLVMQKNDDGDYIYNWVKTGEPLMNDMGAKYFSTVIYSCMTPDKITTFFSGDEVNGMVLDMMEALVDIIEEWGEEFSIAAANRNIIITLIEHFYFSNLTGSRKGTILDALTMGYERKEIYSTPQQKKGFSFKGFLGK